MVSILSSIAWPRHELSPGLLLRLTVLLRGQREGKNISVFELRRDHRPDLRREPGDRPSFLALARFLPLPSGNIVFNPPQLAKLCELPLQLLVLSPSLAEILLQSLDLSFGLAELLLLASKLPRRHHGVSGSSLSRASLTVTATRPLPREQCEISGKVQEEKASLTLGVPLPKLPKIAFNVRFLLLTVVS